MMEIKVVKQILAWNEDVSRQVQELLAEKKVCMINVMGSPGAGKTSLITRIIESLRENYRIGVIEGDIAGQIDADKIYAMGIPVVQLQTDGACHIEAMSIQHMLSMFDLDSLDVLLVENIGNLVCPAEFDTGAALNMMILSVPEGHDKPLKYPLVFQVCNAMIINKIDVMPYFDFDMEKVTEYARMRNPNIRIFPISAKTGEGVQALADWLTEQAQNWKQK